MFKIKHPKKMIFVSGKEIDRNQLKKLSKDEIIDFFIAIIEAQEVRIKALEDQVAKLSKNSSTSSKPPSSDITKEKKPKTDTGKKNKQGAQKGHEGSCRRPFTSKEVDKVQKLDMQVCPDCSGQVQLQSNIAPIIQQTIELVEKPVIITEYQQQAYWCAICEEIHYAPLPAGVIPNQLLGIRLQGLIGYMKGALHCSYSTLSGFLTEVLKMPLSRGLLENTVHRVSKAIAIPYEELAKHIKEALVLYVDESGWKDKGIRYWAWVFANKLLSFFTIEKSRGSVVLYKVLGESFCGAIISDFYSSYVKFSNPIQQFCLAHLIRDIKFLITLKDPAEKRFGKKLLVKFKLLFWLWHKRENIPKRTFKKLMQKVIRSIEKILTTEKTLPPHTKRLSKRFAKHWDSIFRFVFSSNIEPTNNIAERAIRALVLDRRVTQGSRSEWGRQWSARIWTTLATCRKQNRPAWNFINEALHAYYFNAPYPSLIPTTTN